MWQSLLFRQHQPPEGPSVGLLVCCAGASSPLVSGSHVRSTCFSSRAITCAQSCISFAFNEVITPRRTRYKIPLLLKMCQRSLRKSSVPTKVSGKMSFDLLWLGWGPQLSSLQDNLEETCRLVNVEEIIYSTHCDFAKEKDIALGFLLLCSRTRCSQRALLRPVHVG